MRPLADELRPSNLDEICGQEHILGEGGLLRRIIESGEIPNMIFYGPSGIGKTTVANLIANRTQRKLFRLNATTASSADIKEIIGQLDTLLAPNGVLLYLDEIQYFNKKQQQTLLEHMESGKIILIASTTENPYFYVYNAILSRATVFEFKPVSPEAAMKAIRRAVSYLQEQYHVEFAAEEGEFEHIASACGGDIRKAMNALELVFRAGYGMAEQVKITLEDVVTVSQKSAMRYDRDGDSHYDILSAFQKSIRGSDPDAAVHYLARLLEGGDLASPCRRMLVTASEDIGLAYPQAIAIVKACVDAAFQLGLPEARIPLAQAVIFLATCPKSNSAICAIDAAMGDLKRGKNGEIPACLQDAHYAGAGKLGRGLTYQYPHNYPNHYYPQQYLPDELKDVQYYTYGNNKFEQACKKYWDEIKKQSKT